MKRKYLGIGCIILGICISMIPFVKESFEDYRQQKILTLWRQEMSRVSGGEETADTENAIEREREWEKT